MVTGADAKTIIFPLQKIYFENSFLKVILRNQWSTYKYTKEYNCYLLGTYTQEEFMSIAQQYARPFQKIDDIDLAEAARLTLETLGDNLTSGELSQLLNVDPSDIDAALTSYPYAQIDANESQDG